MTGRTAYLNCSSGISGDMIVAALLHLGADLGAMREAVASLDLGAVAISSREVKKGHLSAAFFEVEVSEGAVLLKGLGEVREALDRGRLPGEVVSRCLSVFDRLAAAEGKAHGQPPEDVHFHELGSPDTLVDVLCSVMGFRELGIGEILSSPVNLGSGKVKTSHGVFPVPAPATAELMTGFDVFSDGEQGEKTTPTGAAILSTLGRSGPGIPPMTVEKCGYGAGKADFKRSVNVVQMLVGRPAIGMEEDHSVLIECNIDDMNPQVYPYLTERLMAEGALDVFISPAVMKKGRPGHRVGVLSPPEKVLELGRLLMAESTTIGLRMWPVGRLKAARRTAVMETEWGEVSVKIASIGGEERAVPEFEDCRRVAERSGRPLPEVMTLLRGMAAERFEKRDE